MPHFEFVWTDANVEHLADNGLTPEDAELAMAKPRSKFESMSSGRLGVRGRSVDRLTIRRTMTNRYNVEF